MVMSLCFIFRTGMELKFKTSDDHVIAVNLELILQAETIAMVYSHLNLKDKPLELAQTIEIGEKLATRDVFRKIVEWLRYYKFEPKKSGKFFY